MAGGKDAPEADRILIPGKPDLNRTDNKVISAKYTAWNFLPLAILEQFRRLANVYFLVIGIIMAIGWYFPSLYNSAISPWSTLGPLAMVIGISLLVEGSADAKRHRNDDAMNNAGCVVLSRADQLDADDERDETVLGGQDIVVNLNKAFYADQSMAPAGSDNRTNNSNQAKVAFQKVRRMDIRQGMFVLIKNRDMVPADIVLLASSNDHGSAYIETSSIDGETNLKLRTSPSLPAAVLKHLKEGTPLDIIEEGKEPEEEPPVSSEVHNFETITQASKRIALFSALGRPQGVSCLGYTPGGGSPHQYVSALTTEPPNPSVHTFTGKLTMPPFEANQQPIDIPLGAENVLLRGAVLRNTEWAIGLAFFTGDDTKLIRNSFDTPSKFSILDKLMNTTVVIILFLMIAIISYLAAQAVATNTSKFDDLFYVGFNTDTDETWPYLPDLPAPEWDSTSPNFFQFFLLYLTLLSNFIPLSLYVTVEMVTFCMLWFLYSDLDMYDDTTNTRATARRTTVTDLGRVQYIFSDKTGTLTQNVMRFKRCSVDGMAFGAPIQKMAPGAQEADENTPFLPLRQLLVGRLKKPQAAGLGGLGTVSETQVASQNLTFNAEMFLRVLCLCHTVVVEKDLDKKSHISSGASAVSNASSSKASLGGMARSLFGGRVRANTGGSDVIDTEQMENVRKSTGGSSRGRGISEHSYAENDGDGDIKEKGADGAPYGYAYQAESPDEGALVSAASSTYGFQVVGRDSSGIRLRVAAPSLLEDGKVVDGIKSGNLSMKKLAAQSASMVDVESTTPSDDLKSSLGAYFSRKEREETWSILAVNKFDSDRKRMSILLRSPPELGSLPILFCKGADSAMLDPEVTSSAAMLLPEDASTTSARVPKPSSIAVQGRDVSALTVDEVGSGSEDDDVSPESWEIATMLGIQSHLGDFAREGLRTLVLGLRVLSEDECTSWLEEYKAASVSLKNRSELLTKAAYKVERNLHVVGATAIEDKLQKNVPQTIDTLAKAGIKLWVLTGDKRETAVEIGYSTLVITPNMHLTQVPDNGEKHVQTQMSMEFIRLVKLGKLPDYQKAQLDGDHAVTMKQRRASLGFAFGKCSRSFGRFISTIMVAILRMLCMTESANARAASIEASKETELRIIAEKVRRKKVRERADATIKEWLESDAGKAEREARSKKPKEDKDEDISLASEETPMVFSRANSAKELLSSLKGGGALAENDLRELSLAQLTAQQATEPSEEPVVDEDTLSLNSFFPGNKSDLNNCFDKKKRTALERLFAIDKQVRKGQLKKHMHWEKLAAIEEEGGEPSASASASLHPTFPAAKGSGPRALVIEGAALKHLLGDPETEGILFAVASQCDAVIACRVSPQQKALLVNLVRNNVRPEPITLAIGDGANDVGMIQEAHVGIGISGKEGQQAVNASDFAIAQFRFLETLILIHGRWNFFRLSTVVLFSFYKNALLAGLLILYTPRTLYSGTPLFDEWVITMLNFVAGWPIVFLGLYDRCLGKEYVRKHPEVYRATRDNELITLRTLIRWITLVFLHVFGLFYLTVSPHSDGGGMSSAFQGLMRNKADDRPGNGEGNDLKSVGLITYTSMIILLAYKVLLEGRSLVHGRWPAITCGRDSEGFMSRVAYTWVGITWMSILFYMLGIGTYQLIGRNGASTFSSFVETTNHVFGFRSMSWMLVLFVPIVCIMVDLTGKVFSNLFYPTQTQIHMEIEAKAKQAARLRRIERTGTRRRDPSESV